MTGRTRRSPGLQGTSHWLALAVFLAGSLAPAAPPAAGVRDCRGIADSSARLACYDSAVDQESRLQTTTTPKDPANTVAPAAAPPTGEELFGKSSSGVAESISGAAKVKIPDSLTATISGLAQARDGRVSMTLDNGQLWRQVDTTHLKLRVGDKVTIRAAMMGSFLLTRDGSKVSIRVSRAR